MNTHVWSHSWYKSTTTNEVLVLFCWCLSVGSYRGFYHEEKHAISVICVLSFILPRRQRYSLCLDLRLCPDLHHIIHRPRPMCLGALHHHKWLPWEAASGMGCAKVLGLDAMLEEIMTLQQRSRRPFILLIWEFPM